MFMEVKVSHYPSLLSQNLPMGYTLTRTAVLRVQLRLVRANLKIIR